MTFARGRYFVRLAGPDLQSRWTRVEARAPNVRLPLEAEKVDGGLLLDFGTDREWRGREIVLKDPFVDLELDSFTVVLAGPVRVDLPSGPVIVTACDAAGIEIVRRRVQVGDTHVLVDLGERER